MILDNENENLKVHEWISKYTQNGKLSIVTGYFTIGALAFLSKETKDKIEEYKFILGDIVNFDTDKDRVLDLLNENIGIEASLKLSKVAQEAVEFLELEKVNAKTLEPNFCHAKVYLYKNSDKDPQKDYFISGSSNLTEAGTGMKINNNVELNISGFGAEPQYNELIKWFNDLWDKKQAHSSKTLIDEYGKTKKVPFKQYLIDEIKKIFVEYTPKQLYYKVLFELFGQEILLEKDNPEFSRQIGRLENTVIYNSLYEFQQKGVISLIKMLQKYNGAILADAVGLGKTWTALAVMKFFQDRGREIILICPKKLHHNWNIYQRKQNSRFEKDKLEYSIRFHTDMTLELMERYKDTADKLFTNDDPKLFVIDESHNLRNDKSKRYKFLVEEILSKNADAKILMLTATPINNSFMDIRNQFKLMVGGNVRGFEESLDIKNLDYLFRKAQNAFNEWAKDKEPKIGDLIRNLQDSLVKLTDPLIVARTRKMITGHQNNLTFPEKAKPLNIFVTPKHIGNFESFEELFAHFPPMLSAYQPSLFYEQEKVVDVLHDEKIRDRFLVKMMYILLVKRLESSWFSFKSTVELILKYHDDFLDIIKKYQLKTKFSDDTLQLDQDFDDEEYEDAIDTFSRKKDIKAILNDIDKVDKIEDFKDYIKKDSEALQLLSSSLAKFELKIKNETIKPKNYKSADDKLQRLISEIIEKRKRADNNGNNKVLIFSVYADTAFYLFDQLKARGFDRLAVVSGGSSKVWNEENETKNFEHIIERFAPFTKLFNEKEWKFEPSSKLLSKIDQYTEWKKWIEVNEPKTHDKLQQPIDILIATDTLSEGQNLQDCDLVINYDIHWNPVRVIQRLGRIDRLGSPNNKIYSINFWPSDNINNYLNLQGRIEQRMAAMKLAGSEVNLEFSETFKRMAEDDNFEQKQKARMMEQMQSSWEDVEMSEQNLGFNNLSLETYRQDLLEELNQNQKYYKTMPNGVYTGFNADTDICPEQGIIALLGYPAKPVNTINYKYKSYNLIYIDYEGKAVYINQKEVLDALASHKEKERYVDVAIDQGEAEPIKKLSDALLKWITSQATDEEIQEDGTIKQTMGKEALNALNKLKSGSKIVIENLKNEGSVNEKYNTNNFDLITWFIIS
ncbi:MAG: SNF2-related protein [Bacteroidota bacterium]